MKKFDKRFKLGTKVFVNGEWTIVTDINENRIWIKTEMFGGSFQRGHIDKFSNKY